ncbi:MAG: hypothetical protein KJ067_25730 [Vicinamibacteria bacterium]|jgi:hypothetical protein|nr:hypothetical protein [Vicinamibacteria bacterium]
MNERETAARREPYVRPALRRLDLLAEEVMAVGCKLPTSAGPFKNTPSCTIPSPCLQSNNVS